MLQFHFAYIEIWSYTEQFESVRSWFKTQSLVTIKIKKEREKKTRKRKKRNNRSHDWKKKAPKPCEVLPRSCSVSLNESMKLLRSERTRIIFWRSLPIIALRCGIRLMFPEKTVVFILQSGLKLYDFSIVAASLSWNEQKTKWRPRTECGLTTMNQTTGKAIIRLILDYILFCLNIWSCLNTELHWLQVKRCYFV